MINSYHRVTLIKTNLTMKRSGNGIGRPSLFDDSIFLFIRTVRLSFGFLVCCFFPSFFYPLLLIPSFNSFSFTTSFFLYFFYILLILSFNSFSFTISFFLDFLYVLLIPSFNCFSFTTPLSYLFSYTRTPQLGAFRCANEKFAKHLFFSFQGTDKSNDCNLV